jgi:hypothetical protein
VDPVVDAIVREVNTDDVANALDVEAARCHVSGHDHLHAPGGEGLERAHPLLLHLAAMNANRRPALFSQQTHGVVAGELFVEEDNYALLGTTRYGRDTAHHFQQFVLLYICICMYMYSCLYVYKDR